jgi:hypothetical protein
MLFRTELIPTPVENKIEISTKLLFIGSCFSNNVGDLLKERYFQVMINPFGTVYNPVSIENHISYIIHNKMIGSNEINECNSIYSHPNFHSDFNSTSKNELINNINTSINIAHSFLKETNYIFITLGTSWIYEFINTQKIVANCHKLNQNLYHKRLLSLSEIITSIDNLVHSLRSVNPQINIVFTLSPVRHIKDGLIENSTSKSLLRIAIHERCNDNTTYFPSYEYMMDDLRDYRFYKDDLIHPNSMAIQYIWKKFKATFFSNETINVINRIEKINQFLNHKPSIITDEYKEKCKEMDFELKSLIPH